jgi:Zn-dependent protease with chaperone function
MTRLGGLYIALLLALDLLSIVGVVMLSVQTAASPGAGSTLVVGLLAVAYTVLRALYIKPDEPVGLALEPERYPNLNTLIARAVEKTTAPPFDRVSVLPDANCRVGSVPVGFGFRSRNEMDIGLHLLEILDDDELESIFLHELAHVYRKDTEIGRGVYQNVVRWVKIVEACQKRGVLVNALLSGFARHYVEALEIRVAAVSQQREVLADAEVLLHVDREVYRSACAKLALMDDFVSRFAESGPNDIRALPEPPTDYFARLYRSFYAAVDAKGDRWLSRICLRSSTREETHPSYRERMERLGVADPAAPVRFRTDGRCAAFEAARLTEEFNAQLHARLTDNWEKITAPWRKASATVAAYVPADDFDADLEYCLSLEELGRNEEALAFMEGVLLRHPDAPSALFRVGLLRLYLDDPAGIEPLRRAMELSPECVESGLQTLWGFLLENGLLDRKQEMETWARPLLSSATRQREELENLDVHDAFEVVEIGDDARSRLREGLADLPWLTQAFLVRKRLKESEGWMVVLAVLTRKGVPDADPLYTLIGGLAEHTFVLDLRTAGFRFVKPISRVPGAEVFRRGK